MRKLIWMGCALYLLIGLAHVVLGAILPQLVAYYGVDYKDGGLLIFLQFFGFLIGVVTVPRWAHRVGRRGVVIVALLGLFIGQIVYSILPAWHFMLLIAPLVGFGFGVIEAVISAMIIHFSEGKKAIAISKIEVFFGVGALAMPAIAALFISFGIWRLSFPFIAMYTLVVAIVWYFISFDEINDQFARNASDQQEKTDKKRYTRRMLPVLYLFILFFFLYVGVEMSFVNFLPAMMIENNIANDASATISVAVFWSTMIVGRLFAGVIAEKINYARFLIYGCSGSLLFLILFSFMNELWSTYAVIMAYGLFMAGLFAIGLVAADQAFPGMAMRTISFLVAAGGIGGAVFPLLTGWSMDTMSLLFTKWILIFFTAIMLVVAVLAIQLSKRLHSKNMVQ